MFRVRTVLYKSKTKRLEMFIASADNPCLAQKVGTMRALSGLAPIRLSYSRLRDQRTPLISPRFNVKGFQSSCTKPLKTKGKDSGKSLLRL